MAPLSTIRAWARIFWVLTGVERMSALVLCGEGVHSLVQDKSTEDNEAAVQ